VLRAVTENYLRRCARRSRRADYDPGHVLCQDRTALATTVTSRKNFAEVRFCAEVPQDQRSHAGNGRPGVK
jgi:hypothetical protein